MKIQVTSKMLFDQPYIYPVCEMAQHLCALTRKKTFSIADIINIKQLGYDIEIVGPDLAGVRLVPEPELV